ncbi:hypothetical protein SAMN04488012_101510 [Palleronia salina]|uniref:Uncharacterized protein n=1 Tax=Palleronia salina TaxID=313368 RepID=A0A1M6BID5_9RHOB|nr:hypothetical protein [Palleronia salina]SHI48446.1 hypothetical protein SAMN04488012_101510 [Palleronia salina]
MSDPAKTPEIEDVLASIRRLVSIDSQSGGGRPRPATRAPASKLVLTSDQRVGTHGSGDAAPANRAFANGVGRDAGAEPGDAAARRLEDDPAGALRDTLDDTAHDRPTRQDARRVTEHETPASAGARPAARSLDDIALRLVGDGRSGGSSSLEDRIAQLESAVSSGADFEPDGSEDQKQHIPTAYPSFRTRSGAGAADSASIEALVQQAASQSDGADALSGDELGVANDDHAETGSSLETPETSDPTPAFRHRAMQGSRSHGAEATYRDSGPADPFAGTEDQADIDDAPDDTLRAEGRARPQAEPASDAPNGFEDDDMAEDGILDESALRDLVAEIVREELQGALGERITRNVRKLVRREIMRAITVRNFE